MDRRSKNSGFVALKGSGEFRSCGCRSLARDTRISINFNKLRVPIDSPMPIHEYMPPEHSSSSPNLRWHPFLHRNENIRQSFNNQTLSERVYLVLDFMKSVNINLPILLWAITWNIPELISDPKVSAERTALMVSEELPGILAHWRHPPRKHNSGIRTRAAFVAMNKFKLDMVENEMDTLDEVFKSPQDELSEESLLSIKWVI